MTESEWLTATDPEAMLAFLRETGWANERKIRLFAVACCRELDYGLMDQISHTAVEVAENYADGQATVAELRDAACFNTPDAIIPLTTVAVACFEQFNSTHAIKAADSAVHSVTPWLLYSLLRDIIGPLPFRPLPVLPDSLLNWNGGLISGMAKTIYDERLLPSVHLGPFRLSVMADALTDAGCTHAELLEHLRGPGPHCRGCWAVDLLASKE